MGSIRTWLETDKKSGIIYIRWRGRDRKRTKHSEPAGKKPSYAKELQRVIEKRLDLDRLGEVDHSLNARVLFENWIAKYAKTHSTSSVANITFAAEKLFEFCGLGESIIPIGDITAEKVSEFHEQLLAEKYSPATIYRILADNKNWLFAIRKDGVINWNPFEKTTIAEGEPRPRFYNDDEINALEAAAEGIFLAIMRMGYLAGMREGEILRADGDLLMWNDDGTGQLQVYSLKGGKKKWRTVPLCSEIMELLGTRRQGPLFPGWHFNKLRWHWGKTKRHAKIDEARAQARFYDLRHTFAKIYLQDGGNSFELKEIMGHSSMETLSIYAHFEKAHLLKSVKNLAKRFKFSGHPQGKLRLISPESVQTDANLYTTPKINENEKLV